ncbi:MAG TPA: hypothetical protein VME70_05165 [Mycobacteriales bacterium]|nr:hypothetical protein [Mycobacteriales bacterium]
MRCTGVSKTLQKRSAYLGGSSRRGRALATSSPTLPYAAGFDTTTYAPVIQRFNGTTWSAATLTKKAKHPDQLEGLTMHGRSAWTVGIHNGSEPEILHTAGGVWTVEQTLKSGDTLSAISAASRKHAYAAGSYLNKTDMARRTHLEYFNGHSWKAEPSKV